MTKKITDLKLEEVYRTLSALWTMREPTTIQAVAKNLGVNRIDFFYFVTDANKYHFKIRCNKAGVPQILAYYRNELENKDNPDWLPYMKEKYAKLIFLCDVNNYGRIEGWALELDSKCEEGYGWRNTEEKIKSIVDAGLLKETTFCLGGFGDGWNETHLGFRPEEKDEVVKKLEAAGWTVEFAE